MTVTSKTTDVVTTKEKIQAIVDDKTHGYAEKFALMQIILAQESQDTANELMELVKKLQEFQKNGQKYIDEINSYVEKIGKMDSSQLGDTLIVMIPDDLSKQMVLLTNSRPDNLKTAYDENNKIIGVTCTAEALGAWKISIINKLESNRIDCQQLQVTLTAQNNRLNEINEELKNEQLKPEKRKELEVKKTNLENDISTVQKRISVREQNIKNYYKALEVSDKTIQPSSVYVEGLPQDIVELCKNIGIDLPKSIKGSNGNIVYNYEDVKKLGDVLKTKLGNIEQDIQDNMTLAQTCIGQYNSYLEGAAKACSDLSQFLLNLARNLG